MVEYHQCSVDDCDSDARIRGWCRKHYLRWHTHGDPTYVVDTTKTECKRGHPFTQENTYIDPDGYKNCKECRRCAKRKLRARNRPPHWADMLEPVDGVIEVPLRRSAGSVALVDAIDLVLIRDYASWHLHDTGYASTEQSDTERRRRIYMHRRILQPTNGLEVDHINRDPLDNRRSNLRLATRTQQAANTGLRSDNTSGYKGVSWDRSRRCWYASIRNDGRSVALGGYPNPEDAARAYDVAALAAWGEFAYLNFPASEVKAL